MDAVTADLISPVDGGSGSHGNMANINVAAKTSPKDWASIHNGDPAQASVSDDKRVDCGFADGEPRAGPGFERRPNKVATSRRRSHASGQRRGPLAARLVFLRARRKSDDTRTTD